MTKVVTPLRIGSLFSGIGGLDLAVAHVTGGVVSWLSEIDPYCSAVLRCRWPNVPNIGDISKVQRFPKVDVLCGGFPCQDLSQAGKRAGIEGPRSGLWREYARAIQVAAPKLVFVENVAGILARGIGEVIADLDGLQYDVEWSTLRASDVGAPHLRRRVFLVAVQRALSDTVLESLLHRMDRSGQPLGRHHGWPPAPNDQRGWERWTSLDAPLPGVRRGAYGASSSTDARRRRARLRCLGNAVVTQQAVGAYGHLLERILSGGDQDAPFARREGELWQTAQASLFETAPPFAGPWPVAGTMRDGCLYRRATLERAVAKGDSPHAAPTPSATPYGSSGNGTGNNVVSAGRASLEAWAKTWPTPLASDDEGGTRAKDGKRGESLRDAVRRWPTPCRTDAKDSARRTTVTGVMNPGDTLTDVMRGSLPPANEPAGKGGSNVLVLNPGFVEALMGFPPEWTFVDDELAFVAFNQWRGVCRGAATGPAGRASRGKSAKKATDSLQTVSPDKPAHGRVRRRKPAGEVPG